MTVGPERAAIVLESEIATDRILRKGTMTAMQSLSDAPLTATLDGATMPRFQDGTINMQELLRQLAESVVNEIMDAEADQMCGEGNSRNGYRERKLMTCVGTLTLRVPKLRVGSFFPDDVLTRYQRVDRALVAAVAETCAAGTSTRKVQRVARKMGIDRLSKDQVSTIARDLDADVEELLSRDLSVTRVPYLWLDATYVKCRRGGPRGVHGGGYGHRLRRARLEARPGRLRR